MEEEKVFEMPSGFQGSEHEAKVKAEDPGQENVETAPLVEDAQSEPAAEIVPKKTRQTAPQISEEEMYQIIRDYKESGLTRRAFCLKRDYPMSNFYYWQKKYYQKFPDELADKPKRGKPGKQAKKATKVKATTARKTKAAADKKTKAATVKKTEAADAEKAEAVTGKKTRATTSKKAKELAETTATPAVVIPEAVEVTPKRRGRPPKKAADIATAEAPVKAAAKATKTKATQKTAAKETKAVKKSEVIAAEPTAPAFKGVYMQIKYPNGIRINIPADIDMKRLKELMQL